MGNIQLLLNGGCEHMYCHCLREHSSIEIPQPGFTIEIEVAAYWERIYQENCNSPGIIDLQGIKFRHLSWIKRMSLRYILNKSRFLWNPLSLDHGNLQLQDLIRLETMHFTLVSARLPGALILAILVARSRQKNALSILRSERQRMMVGPLQRW